MAGTYIDQRTAKYVGRPNGVVRMISHLTQGLRAVGRSQKNRAAMMATMLPTRPNTVTTKSSVAAMLRPIMASRMSRLARKMTRKRPPARA